MPTFGVTADELSNLMRMRAEEASEALQNDFGGIDGLAEKVQTSLTNGLTGENADISERQNVFGPNTIPPRPPKSIFELMFDAVQDTTLIVLLIAASVSLVLSFSEYIFGPEDQPLRLTKATEEAHLEWVEAVAIMGTVAIVVVVTAVNDWMKERQFRALQSKIEGGSEIPCLRSGNLVDVNIHDLVVGDVIQVKYGDLIPADGVIIQCADLKIDESSLTGESDLIKKSISNDPVMLSGTHVMEGAGRMIVTAVGLHSQTGIIFKLLGAADNKDAVAEEPKKKLAPRPLDKDLPVVGEESAEDVAGDDEEDDKDENNGQSVLQAKLTIMAMQIGWFGTVAALFTFFALLIRLFATYDYSLGFTVTIVKSSVRYLIIAITVLVVAVPEGLPLAVTLALAFSVRKMMKDNNLVRHLDACETMGNATCICSDKTGTLTTNRMTCVELYAAEHHHHEVPPDTNLPINVINVLCESIAINTGSTSRIEISPSGGLPKQLGNKTECAMLGLVYGMGQSYEEIRNQYPEANHFKVFTFHSGRKAMATLIETGPQRNVVRVHVKGASERVVGWCGFQFSEVGDLKPFDEKTMTETIEHVIEPMADHGLRTIGIAYKDIVFDAKDKTADNIFLEDKNDESWYMDEKKVFSNLTLIGITGIEDPVRPEVPDSIKKCQNAGVCVRMVTGDNVNTARSIATKCGIIQDHDGFLVMEGPKFNEAIKDQNGKIRQELLDKIWPKLRVLARSSPEDKYTLVRGIINSKRFENRQVVAVTGDGTNDGPALKKADVGFAMGIAGTEVAKEASDIILTDDNFTSIVRAIVWGRNIYDSIAKFLQFQLTVNVVAITVAMSSALLLSETPIKAAQMLWVNLIMDTLASLALATEPPTDALLNRKPYGRNKSLISKTMFKNILGQSVYQITVTMVLLFAGPNLLDFSTANYIDHGGEPTIHYTFIFHTFVIMTLFNQFNARKIHNERNAFEGIANNPWFICIWLIEFTMQALLVEFAGQAMQTHPLSADLWMWSFAFGSGVILFQQIISSTPSYIIPSLSSIRKTKVEHRQSVLQAAERASETSFFLQNPRMKHQLHEIEHAQGNLSRATSPPLTLSVRDTAAKGHISQLRGRSTISVNTSSKRDDDRKKSADERQIDSMTSDELERIQEDKTESAKDINAASEPVQKSDSKKNTSNVNNTTNENTGEENSPNRGTSGEDAFPDL